MTMIATLGLNGIVARLLAPEGVGQYFLVLSVVTFGAAVAGLGLTQGTVKLVAEAEGTGKPSRARSALELAFLASLLSAGVTSGFVALGGLDWVGSNLIGLSGFERLSRLTALLVIVTTFVALIAESFRGFHDIRTATVSSGLAGSVMPPLVLGALWALSQEIDLRRVLWVHVVSGVLVVVWFGVLLARRVNSIDRGDGLSIWQVLRTAWPLLIVNVTLLFQSRVGLWIAGSQLSSEGVALFGAAEKLTSLLVAPLLVLNSVVPPIIAELYVQDRKSELQSILQGATALIAIPATIVAIIFLVSGSGILAIVFGDYYSAATPALIILSAGLLANVAAGPCGQCLMMTDQQKPLMAIAMLSVGSQLVLGPFLATQFGVSGVALAVSISLVLMNLAMLAVARRRLGVWTYAWLSTSDLAAIRGVLKLRTG